MTGQEQQRLELEWSEMFLIKRFQGDEPNKRCHERVCLVTNTQRAGEGCRSQVPLFCLCVWCGYHGNSGTSACLSGETSDKWTGVLHMPCVMLEMTVNRAFYFVIKYLVLFVYFNHSFTTVFLEVTVVTVAHFC